MFRDGTDRQTEPHTHGHGDSMTNSAQWGRVGENHMICIFAVILICLLPSDHAVDKMSVGHANENEIYILYFILFENY